MHVAVAFCGIELDGLEEVPLRFCFLPLRDGLNTVSLLFQLLLKTTHFKKYRTQLNGQNTFVYT